ncbi:Condensin-2 complex subunit h2 [Globisporangium polare]
MSAESSRFTHLLQPIRDLSKNWNIDLAQELEEYLDELEHLNIAFDPQDDGDASSSQQFSQSSIASSQGTGGARVMNFAEAALLIQGTSAIYSRKVEYLYALVFQTLAHLSKQQDRNHHGESQDGTTGDNGDGGSDPNGGGGNAHDIFLNPLPMFDELDEARNITLKSNSIETQRPKSGGALAKSNTNIQASISLMGSLIPDERDHGETFKLLSCNLHPSGVLLLDETSKKYLGYGEGDDDGESGQRGFGSAFARERLKNPVAALNFDNDDDDDGGGVDHGYNDEDYGAEGGGTAEGKDDADAPEIGRQVTFASAPTYSARVHHEERDPWAPLDPYDASSATSRPFRKGRSYPKRKKEKIKKSNKKGKDDEDEEVIDGLDDPQFKERFFFGASRPQWSSWVWTETRENALESKLKKKFCKAPMLVKSCDELWKLETKWKGLLRRCEAKEEQSAQAMLLQEKAEEEEEQMHALGMNMVNGTNALDLDVNEDGDNDSSADDYDGDAGFETGGDWDQGDNNFESAPASYTDTSADGYDLKTNDDPDRPLSYEDICRQHIKTFMQGTEKYVRETNLSKQVDEWQAKLNPILKEQDLHPPFDIHTYGRDIIGHLEEEIKVKQEEHKIKPKRKARAISEEAEDDDEKTQDGEVTIPFGEIVGGMSQYQVCRMFLASLQLANNGNVHLVHGHSAAEQIKVPFQMQLLSTSNVYESIQQQEG